MNADQHVPLSALGIDEEALFEGKRAISERQWQRLRDTARLVLPTDVWLAFDAVMDATEAQFVRADWFANDDDGISNKSAVVLRRALEALAALYGAEVSQ